MQSILLLPPSAPRLAGGAETPRREPGPEQTLSVFRIFIRNNSINQSDTKGLEHGSLPSRKPQATNKDVISDIWILFEEICLVTLIDTGRLGAVFFLFYNSSRVPLATAQLTTAIPGLQTQ